MLGEVVIFGGWSNAVIGETWTGDTDGDGLPTCDDPDGWGRCALACPPGTSCSGGFCGDGVCDPVEVLVCDDDC